MKKTFLILAASIIVILVILAVLSRFLVDLLWFDSLGFKAVFTTAWLTVLIVFFLATLLSSAILLINGFIATRNATTVSRGRRGFRVVGRNTQGLPEIIEFSLDKIPWRLIIPGFALLLGLFIGFAQTSNWDTMLKWFYAAPFGRSDPLFGYDIGYQQAGFPTLSPAATRHFSALLAAYFLVKAAGYILARYDLMISNNGVVFGAAYKIGRA